MREIKCEAWDSVNKKMLSWNDIGWKEGDPRFSTHSLLSGQYAHLTPRFYTGLKDKNGKEIYWGDTCEGEHATYVIQWDEKFGQYKAKIIATKSVLSKHCAFPLWQYVEDDGKCRFEVIGNIYEHPHLLTVTE